MGSLGPDLLQEPSQTTAGCEVKGGLASHPRTPVYAQGHSQEKCRQKTQDLGVGRLPRGADTWRGSRVAVWGPEMAHNGPYGRWKWGTSEHEGPGIELGSRRAHRRRGTVPCPAGTLSRAAIPFSARAPKGSMVGTRLSAVLAPGQGQGVREPLLLPSSCPARTPINPVRPVDGPQSHRACGQGADPRGRASPGPWGSSGWPAPLLSPRAELNAGRPSEALLRSLPDGLNVWAEF